MLESMRKAWRDAPGGGWVLFGVLAVVLVLPVLLLPNPLGIDGPVHIHWQVAFAETVWHGHLYPRWLPDMNQGFGSPAFFFYPPLLQTLGALFVPIAPGDHGAIARLALALVVLALAGAQGCRLWARALGLSARAALLGGALWLAMPYRALVDSYQRCALAECASLAVLPWLGLSAVWVAQGRRRAWAGHALAIAALAYAHLPGMVIGYLFAAGHGLALVLAEAEPRQRLRLAVALAGSALAGLAVAATMLVPALGLLGHLTDTTAMFGEAHQPHNWLLFGPKPWADYGMFVATAAILAMTAALALVLVQPVLATPDRQARHVGWAMFATVVAVGLLNLNLSRPVWDLQTPLSRIQFPFRLLGASSLALCMIAAIAHDRCRSAGRTALWLVCAGLLLADAAGLVHQRLYPSYSIPLPPTRTQIFADSQDTSEYVLGDLPAAEQAFGPRQAFAPDGPAPAIGPVHITARHVALDYRANTPTAIALHQFAFTGWQCRIDDGAWTPASALRLGTAHGGAHVPLCTAPAGAHRLEARLPASAPERIGVWITLAGLAIVVVSLAVPYVEGSLRRASTNDADRLRKYLGRFGLDWDGVK
jgi:hypothetical protein